MVVAIARTISFAIVHADSRVHCGGATVVQIWSSRAQAPQWYELAVKRLDFQARKKTPDSIPSPAREDAADYW